MSRYFTVFSADIPSGTGGGATETTVTFDVGRAYTKVYLDRATMASVATIQIYGSVDGTKWTRVVDVAQTQVATSAMAFEISTASSGYAYAIPAGWPYYKIDCTSSPTDGLNVKLLCVGD